MKTLDARIAAALADGATLAADDLEPLIADIATGIEEAEQARAERAR